MTVPPNPAAISCTPTEESTDSLYDIGSRLMKKNEINRYPHAGKNRIPLCVAAE